MNTHEGQRWEWNGIQGNYKRNTAESEEATPNVKQNENPT